MMVQGYEMPKQEITDPCKLKVTDISKMIEMGIGCSKVGTTKVYTNKKLWEIYESR
jgi:hypothetical protein